MRFSGNTKNRITFLCVTRIFITVQNNAKLIKKKILCFQLLVDDLATLHRIHTMANQVITITVLNTVSVQTPSYHISRQSY